MTKTYKIKLLRKVIAHFKKQGVLSVQMGSGDSCLYRGPKGTSCAIGCLIDDKHYKKSLEFKSVINSNDPNEPDIQVLNALKKSGIEIDLEDRDGLKFLDRLQAIHDDSDFLDEAMNKYRAKLRQLIARA